MVQSCDQAISNLQPLLPRVPSPQPKSVDEHTLQCACWASSSRFLKVATDTTFLGTTLPGLTWAGATSPPLPGAHTALAHRASRRRTCFAEAAASRLRALCSGPM